MNWDLVTLLFVSIMSAYFATLLERKRNAKVQNMLWLESNEARKAFYTGQKCVECQVPECDVYPAVCDTCGAWWPADMRIEGEPRKQRTAEEKQ